MASEIQEWVAAIGILNNTLIAVSDNDRLVVRNNQQSTWTSRDYPRKASNILRSRGDGKDAERDSPTKKESVLPTISKRRVIRGTRTRLIVEKPIDKSYVGDIKTKIKSM